MRIAVVGLGKLGLPVALTLAKAGHEVMGWDASETRRQQILDKDAPEASYEPHLADYLATTEIPLLPIPQLIGELDPEIVLVCVQTPHEPDFEGVTPLERDPQDFSYAHLRGAITQVWDAVADAKADPLVVIVSTCLPGTFDRELRPFTEGHLRVAYHPLFIAMGSVIEDYRWPEFLLVGADNDVLDEVTRLYEPLYGPMIGEDGLLGPERGLRLMSITSAELTKVAYNAAIGFKILLANSVAEICDKVDADADDVMDTLKLATKRLVSTAYMTPGMGDGGGCHPRDQIALSWLAGDVDLSSDPFGMIVEAREGHAQWLAAMWVAAACKWDLPMVMLGEAYKADTPLTTGSHARLVGSYLRRWDRPYIVVDHHAAGSRFPAACYFLSCPHRWALEAELPEGSVVVDPWGAFPEREGVTVVRPGRRADLHQQPRPCDVPASADRVA